jgi:hypothetical protein
MPRAMHIVVGDGRVVSVRTTDVHSYAEVVRERLEAGSGITLPYPPWVSLRAPAMMPLGCGRHTPATTRTPPRMARNSISAELPS